MHVGSLFSGIGGLDLGLELAGMSIRWQVECDDYCLSILTKHWPHVPKYRDVRNLPFNDLDPVDLICGGFPCQDLSNAGSRLGITGPRSGLWFAFANVIQQLKPRWVLIENVPGILSYMPYIIGPLVKIGYVGVWHSLYATFVGAPHRRLRTFIVGYLADSSIERLQRINDTRNQTKQTLRESRTSISSYPPRPQDPAWKSILRLRPDLAPSLEPSVRRVAAGLPDWMDRAITNAMSNRRKRLMALGNAVVPQLAEVIGRAIISADRIITANAKNKS